MAISTNGVMLTRLTGALYNQQLGAATYAEVLAGNSTAAALNTWANAAVAADFGSKTDLQVATTLITNVGLSSVAGLANWVAGQLTAGGVAKRGETIISLLNSYSNMDTTEAIYGASVATFNTKVDASQALSQTTGNAGGTYAAVSSVVVNTALTLTSATQTSTGTAGDDTFTAAAGTWGAGDVVNGAAGTDTLNATITGTGPTQSATSLVGIETLNLTASPNPSTLDLTGVTGLTSVNNVSSANGATLTVSGLGNMVNTTITGSQAATTLTYTTAAVASTTADTMTATLNNVSAGSSLSVAGVENLTIASTGVANTLSTLTDAALIKLTLTGDKALTIGGTTGGALLTTVDAAAATGAITLSTGAGPALTGVTVTGPSAATAGLFTVTTSSGKDTVTTGAGNSVIETGSGNDTITTGAGTTTVTPGTGNDALTLGAGVDTVRFAETGAADSDVITGFGATDVMAFRLGQVTAAATTTTGATTLGAGIFGTLQTSATSPSLSNVNGVGTGTAIAFQAIAPNATATTGTVTGTSNVIALNGAYTDGTAAGVISALGSSAVEGIATTPTGKFLLVTYSVGNIAQVWSYAGDATVDTNITSTELSLIATLNGVAQNALTAANFATYLGAGSTVLTQSNAGQTVTVSTPLNIITTTANANGAYLTAGSDTINVNIGMLPTNTATTAMGLTVLDGSTSDSDTLNATVLGTNFAAGLLLSNIETVNLEQTVGGAAFDAAAVMPGTKNFGFTGTGNQATISNLPASSTITFGAGRTGSVTATQTTAGTFDVALNGSGVAATSLITAPTAPSLSLVGGTNSTITVTGTSFLSSFAGATTPFANTNSTTGTNTITGTGNLTLLGTGTQFAAHVGAVSSTYTGSLTLRPSNDVAFDLSGAGADTTAFTGVKTIDLTAFSTAETITLAAANGAWPVTVTSNNATGIGALTVSQAGSGTTDALTVTVTNAAANITSIAASSLETLIVNLGGTVGTTLTKSVGGITLATNAATQSVTVNSNAATTTLGIVTADSLNATGVAGIVTATLANGASGAVFTGPASTASYVIGNGLGEIITTGTANDAIYVATGTSGSANLTGGLGNDTYGFAHTTVNSSQITDTSGTDTLALITGGASNIAGLNSGASLVTSGIEQVVVVTSGVMSIATGQVTGAVAFNTSAAGGVLAITQTTAGTTAAPAVTSLASATFTTFNYLDNAGTSTAGTAGGSTIIIGTTGVDSIVGSTLADNITGGGGADTLVGGAGSNTYNFATAANLAAATVTGGTGTDTVAISAATITLVDTNFTTHTSVETLTLGGGVTATTLGAFANTAGIRKINTGIGATTITANAITPLDVVSSVVDDSTLTIGAGNTSYTITNLVGNLLVSDTLTGSVDVTVAAVADTTLALGTDTTGTKAVTATALTDGQILTLTGSDAATVSFANGDVTANLYAGALTVTGTGTTGQFTTGTASSSISSTGATAIVATALADGQVLSTSGAGVTTITGLIADLTDTSTAAQVITVAAVPTITLALGTDTTGDEVITATALTNGQVLTLTGSNNAAISFANGDLTATAFVGALTVTGTGTTGQFTTGTASSSISSTGATAIVATALADGQVLSTSGAGVTTITGLIADLTDTSTAAQVITVAAVPTITLALGTDTTGDEVITATALTDGQVLTLTGTNNVAISFANGDITASAHIGALTVTGTGTTGQFTTGTVSSSISSTGATAIVATAMADGQTLSTSGAGVTTITGLQANLTDTSTAAQIITVVAVPTITLALGTDTVGIDAVTATALTDGQVLTMTGSNDVTVALNLGDLSAAAYAGAMTITATAGTNVITGGTGIDIITGGAAGDTMAGGTGDVVDTFILNTTSSTVASASNTTLGVSETLIDNLDTLTFTNGVDVITDMGFTGAGNLGIDLFDVTTAGATYINLSGVTAATALAAGSHYYLQGTYTEGVFTVNSAANAGTENVALLIVADAIAATPVLQTSIVILTGVSAVAANFSAATFI